MSSGLDLANWSKFGRPGLPKLEYLSSLNSANEEGKNEFPWPFAIETILFCNPNCFITSSAP